MKSEAAMKNLVHALAHTCPVRVEGFVRGLADKYPDEDLGPHLGNIAYYLALHDPLGVAVCAFDAAGCAVLAAEDAAAEIADQYDTLLATLWAIK